MGGAKDDAGLLHLDMHTTTGNCMQGYLYLFIAFQALDCALYAAGSAGSVIWNCIYGRLLSG